MNPKYIKLFINILRFAAPVAVGLGLLINLCLKNDSFKDIVLPLYPKYALAENGIKTLENMRFPAKESKDKEVNVGVLDIDNESWGIMIDFLKSEIAFRKSERNEPVDFDPKPSESSVESQQKDNSVPLAPINWDRVKTIISVRVDVMKAGTKPLVAPYRLIVIWPPPTARRVYEFLSFQEFRLDMKKVLVKRLEYFATLMSIIAFVVGLIIAAARRFLLPKFSILQNDRMNEKIPNKTLPGDS